MSEQSDSTAALGENRIASTAVDDMKQLGLGLVLASLASIPIVVFLPEELANGNDLALVALVFPFAALCFALALLRRWLAWRRFGRLVLVMDPFPGSLGGDVGGQVDLPLRYGNRHPITVALACSRIEKRSEGADRESVIWDRDGLAEAAPAAAGTRVRFRFAVPVSLPASSEDGDTETRWGLRLRVPGRGFDRTFALPVTASDPERSRARIADSHETLLADGAAQALPRGIRIERQGDSMTLHLAAFRNVGLALTLTAIGGILTVPAGGLASVAGDLFGGGLFDLILAVVPGLIALVCGLLGLLLMLAGLRDLGRSRTVLAEASGITVTSRLFGLPFGTERLAKVTGFDTEVGSRVGNGPGSKKVVRLIARDGSGGKLVVADGIRDPALLRRLIQDLASATGLPAPPTT
jgi:hypothetical protein